MEPTETIKGFSGNDAWKFIKFTVPCSHPGFNSYSPLTYGSGTIPGSLSATSPVVDGGPIVPRSRGNNKFSANIMKLMIHRTVK